MKSWKQRIRAIGLLALLTTHSPLSAQLLPFQGQLASPDGSLIPDGAKVIQFKIYDAPIGGTTLWNGEVHQLSVNSGVVNTILGSKSSLSGVDFSRTLYLEITMDANGDGSISPEDPPLLPRQLILPSPFSIRAAKADVAEMADDTQFVQGEKLLREVTSSDGATVKHLVPDLIQPGSIPASAISPNNDATPGISGAQLSNESVDFEKLTQAVLERLIPAGTVIAFAGPFDQDSADEDLEDNIPSGWILCDGRTLNRESYPNLFAAIGTSWGSGTEISDANDLFRVPDLRGVFLRGVDNSPLTGISERNPGYQLRVATANGGNSGNQVGSFESDATRVRLNSAANINAPAPHPGAALVSDNAGHKYTYATTNPTWRKIDASAAFDATYGQADETRPKNAFIHYLIKY